MGEPAGNLNAIVPGEKSSLYKCEKGDTGFGAQGLFIPIGLETNAGIG